jgi:hypothetical protein
MLNVSCGSVQSILKENQNMCLIAAKFVPNVLSQEQKNNHVNECQDFHKRHERNPEFLSKVITWYET